MSEVLRFWLTVIAAAIILWLLMQIKIKDD